MRRTTRRTGATPSGLGKQAFKTVDDDQRNDLISRAQQMEFEQGGYIVWAWRNQVDAYSRTTTGYKLDKLGGPIGRMYFKDACETRHCPQAPAVRCRAAPRSRSPTRPRRP